MATSQRIVGLVVAWLQAHPGHVFETGRRAREWGVSTRHVRLALQALQARGELWRDPSASPSAAARYSMDPPDPVHLRKAQNFEGRQGPPDRVRRTLSDGSAGSMTGSGGSIGGTVSENRAKSGVFGSSRAPASPVHASGHAPPPAPPPVHGIHGSEERITEIHGIHGGGQGREREPGSSARPVPLRWWLEPDAPPELRRELVAMRALSHATLGPERHEDFRLGELVKRGHTAVELAEYFRTARSRFNLVGLEKRLVRVADPAAVKLWLQERAAATGGEKKSSAQAGAPSAPAAAVERAPAAELADAPLRGGPGMGPKGEPDGCEPGRWPAPASGEPLNRLDSLGRWWVWVRGLRKWLETPSAPATHKTGPSAASDGTGVPGPRLEGSGGQDGPVTEFGALVARVVAGALRVAGRSGS